MGKSTTHSCISDQVDDELLDIFSSATPPLLSEFQTPLSLPEKNPDLTQKPVSSRRRKPPASLDENDGNPNASRKKIIHRDVERQRRQEMASLYASIRSLLPQEYLKGKRSVSDHMQETVSYIKCLQTRMKELRDKRDALKRVSNISYMTEVEQLLGYNSDLVTVRESWAGVEILVDTAIAEHGLPLSTLLQALEEEGLHLINCVSTIIKDRSLYTIETEITGETKVDLSELQKRLTKLVSMYLS